MNVTIPTPFLLRIELQALSNGLRRATSDRLKLLRLAENALATVEENGLGDAALRARLRAVRETLQRDLPLNRLAVAAEFQRFSAAIGTARPPVAPRRPALAAR